MATAATSGGARVYLHIGEPKTGSTFLQQLLWSNRAELAAHGVRLPGHHGQDHFRATQDLLEVPRAADDPAASWTGEWDVLAGQALSNDGTSVISSELLCAASAEQAVRAITSLRGAQVHMILTVRDMTTLLPAEWQESVKHRYRSTYPEWLEGVIDAQSEASDRRRFWFWRVHDTVEILRVWAALLPPEQVHVVFTPGASAPPDELWRRFAGVIGVEPAVVDLSRAGRNSALGVVEIEFLRRLNAALADDVPEWFYLSDVKEPVAHEYLRSVPRSTRLALPPGRRKWASRHNEQLRAALTSSGFHLVGSLEDLTPPMADTAYVAPDEVPAAALAEVAVGAAAALSVHHYRSVHERPPRPTGNRGLVARIEEWAAGSARLKRVVRTSTARCTVVRKARVWVWRALERARGGH